MSLRHSTHFKFRLLGLFDLVVQCFHLISGRFKYPVITLCEYLSHVVDIIIFRSSALFSSAPTSLLYMHPKISLDLFLSLSHDRFHKPINGNTGIIISSHDCSIDQNGGKLSCGGSIRIVGNASVDHIENLSTSVGFIAKKRVRVLRDTGCNGVMIRKDLVFDWKMN